MGNRVRERESPYYSCARLRGSSGKSRFTIKAGDLGEAILTYRFLIKKHHNSPAAKKAAGLIERVEERIKRQAEQAKAKAAEAKVPRILAIAKKLENFGKPSQAVKLYREVVRDYPKSPAAKEAAERIKGACEMIFEGVPR